MNLNITDMKEEIIEIVTNLAEQLGYKLVEFSVDEKHKRVYIVIYKKTGITIQDCEDMTKELLQDMDYVERFGKDYNLEVSSPGVERFLKTIEEYKIFEGKEVKIITDIEETPVITGVLKGLDNEDRIIIEDGFKMHRIPYGNIKKGVLLFNFSF
ncbi:MAG: ribosome maturation factor RimP [Spirochaetes bacterium]|nr:ribosome maturation factor RimP [Spirochaetota bacterium]